MFFIKCIFNANNMYRNKDKTKNSDSNIRSISDFGNHENDFEKRCCFKHQIERIGIGTRFGSGELVEVDMRSGKTAIYQLFSEKFNPIFQDTGQRNWKYYFIKYK